MICTHCGTLNDVDLRRVESNAGAGTESTRSCPRCDESMISITLGGESQALMLDRCKKCLGIFFDLGELESMITESGKEVFAIDHARIQTLISEEYHVSETKVQYVKCPVCREMMHRKNYGAKSGVVVDTCRDHGIWLDGGELGQILKWVKAGGRLHDADRKLENLERKEREERVKRRAGRKSSLDEHIMFDSDRGDDINDLGFESLIKFFFKW
jgi:Zn-finger nucleic acid-binding protein